MANLDSAEKTTTALHRSRWYQYRLSTLLIVMLLFAIGSAWLRYQRLAAQKAWKPINTIQKAYSDVNIRYGQSAISKSMWIEKQLGIDFPNDVTDLSWNQPAAGPFVHDQVAGMHALEKFALHPAGGVKDEDLLPLSKLSKLRSLQLIESTITGEGFRHFVERDSLLSELSLHETKGLTENGLAEVASLKHLRSLSLHGSDINDEMLKALSKSQSIERLYFPRIKPLKRRYSFQVAKRTVSKNASHQNPDVTAEGLRLLAQMPNLKEIMVFTDDVELLYGKGTLMEIRPDIKLVQFCPLIDQ